MDFAELVELKYVAGACANGECPTIFSSGPGVAVVQGELITGTDVDRLLAGEARVAIPAALLFEACRSWTG